MCADQLISRFHLNDRVSFHFNEQTLHGMVARLNAKRAYIVCDDESEYRVPYALLTPISTEPRESTVASEVRDASQRLAEELAIELLARHQLDNWTLRFDNATRRAGCCRYDRQVISLSFAFVRHCSDQEIRETLLHEIAHALVGKGHNHDMVWRAKAIEIGCSGSRLHRFQFAPPRYIVRCQNDCWILTAERRRRGAICKKCRGGLVYQTFTEERWQREKSRLDALKKDSRQ